MITSTEITDYSEADLHYVLCMANMEGAQQLCRDMINGGFSGSFSHATVIMSLVHHGVELFLKYAICKANKKTPNNHYIRGLLKEYDAAYPDECFRLDLPFVTQFIGHTEEEVQKLVKNEEQYKNRTDQMGRYHCDQFGLSWEGFYAFIPVSFLTKAESLTARFLILRSHIESDNG